MHESDVDYTAANVPEDELSAMMESALSLAMVLQGEGRRRVDAEGKGVTRFAPPLMVSVDPGYDPPAVSVYDGSRRRLPDPAAVVADPPRHDPEALRSALAAAHAHPPSVSGDEAAALSRGMDAITRQVGALRLLKCPDAVVGHALNSIDLGLVGLARAVGNGESST